MPYPPHVFAEWAAAVRRHLDAPGRSITWLGKEVARIEGRPRPYSQPAISGGWLKESPPDPPTVFAIEEALTVRPGTLSRLLGYLPASARAITSFRDVVDTDPALDDTARRTLIAAYGQLVDHRADARADHP